MEVGEVLKTEVGTIVSELKNSYKIHIGSEPRAEEISAWYGSITALKRCLDASKNAYLMFEYRLPIGDQRIDFLLIDHTKALVIETKGWKTIKIIDDVTIETEGSQHQHPCYQLEDYLVKLREWNTASKVITFDGFVYLYNSNQKIGNCRVINSVSDAQDLMSEYASALPADKLEIENGKFTISKSLVTFLNEKGNLEKMNKSATAALLGSGYGLSEEQLLLLKKILSAVREKENKAFFVKGGSGSGKTLVAITLLLEALKENYRTVMGYRNNRLVNTLRTIFDGNLGAGTGRTLINYYSTGHGTGLGESQTNDKFDFVIYDEAQRMNSNILKNTMERGQTTAYFYDENQILIGDEDGTTENFVTVANMLKIPHEVIELTGFYRCRGGRTYYDFVESVLKGEAANLPDTYDFKIFNSIEEFLIALENKRKLAAKVSLLAAFTKSDGYKNKVRVDYTSPKIEWLMDEAKEYPDYWLGKLNPLHYCASIYGCQGFESDYAGVIWGEDFIRREGYWDVNSNEIKDSVGKIHSLKALSNSNKSKALQLLKNRYRILLTRGIMGTYLYFEDQKTKEFIKSLIKSP